jgi:hypothetical protein
MANTANQIETHIERQRETLGSNIHELEQKVKSVTDWKHYFHNNPMTMIGVAFGGGVLLAKMLGNNNRHASFSAKTEYSSQSPGLERQKNKASETVDNIKAALIGLATTRVKQYIGEIVPGFDEQFQRTQSERAKSLTMPGTVS